MLKLDALWKMELVSRVPEGLQDSNGIRYPLLHNRVPQSSVLITRYLTVPVGHEFGNDVDRPF